MSYRVFTKDRLDGIDGKDKWLQHMPEALAIVDAKGAVLTTCWCCGKRIVIGTEDTALNFVDKAYLAEEDAP